MSLPFPILPFGTKDYLYKVTASLGLNPNKAFYKCFFIRDLRDEDGQIVTGTIKARFIYFIADTFSEADLLTDKVRHLMGDAFHYSHSLITEGVQALTETDVINEGIELHLRARPFRAQSFLEAIDKSDINMVMTTLLESKYAIQVERIPDPIGTGSSYQARVNIMPSSAFFKEDNTLLSPDMISAIDQVLNSPIQGYEKNIDPLFDKVAVNLLGNIGEFPPLKTKAELMEYLRKVVLQSTLGDMVQ